MTNLSSGILMQKPNGSGRSWIKWAALTVAIGSVGGFGVVNFIDYRSYDRAARFEQAQGIDRVRELAALCFELGKDGHKRFDDDFPAGIDRLHPLWASIDHDYAQIGLYRRGEYESVFLVFERHGENEVVTVCDYTRGKLDMRRIYVKDQAAYDFMHPRNRIVTLAQSTMHEFTEWIVLPQEIRVISQPGSGGPQILGRRPISAEERKAVEEAVRDLPDRVRGRHFHAEIMDGIHLLIRLGMDGQAGPADIELDNTWREEAGPLVDLVARLSPPGQELKFRELIQRDMQEYPRQQFEITWPEEAKRDQPPLPWWCVWPRLGSP